MADHHCCSSHCHSDEASSSNTDQTKSSNINEISHDDLRKHLTLNENDNDNKNDESHTVSQLFDIAWSNQNDLQSPSANTTTDDYSSKLLHTIRLLESLEKRLQSLELFSDNEYIDELSTTNIRYLLVYAFLAWLYQTKRSKPSQRLINVQHAYDYYLKFLTMTKNYGLHKYSIPKAPTNQECENTEQLSSRDVDMMKMAQDRASKIRGHLKRREEEESMKAFEEAMKHDLADEEAKRNFYLSKIQWWINIALDDLDYLHDELRVLLQRQSIESTNDEEIHKRPQRMSPSRPLKPMIITHDQLQSKAIGIGYPSIPTMTIDEFYQSLAQRGLAPTPEQVKEINAGPKFPKASDAEKEEIAKETYIEKDDPDMIKHLRSMDDFKDDNRRGEGNRHNRS
ncbi:unnamed protein product [Rotaria sp. Silwood2]|nr:unnamed protein product [Rotaria sp. Silwood2]CAF2742486.1 unnamed protein product [Rotaria sp. Silwood2]CAF2883919.1 unnamed protein product [Rotaria sp. Silwood2]CAF4048245.1 unnamed protein product [Rotaria sp. Silwood2]CAF4119252.1 unnamed protein product [Rotaria sp. Silwood2]